MPNIVNFHEYIKIMYAACISSKKLVSYKYFLIMLVILPVIYHKFSKMYKNKMYFISIKKH